METKSRHPWKVVLTASLMIAVVAAAVWTLRARADSLRHKSEANGLTTLDPQALAEAQDGATDTTRSVLPGLRGIDSLMAPFAGMMAMDSVGMAMTGLSDDIQIQTKPDRLLIDLCIPNLNQASLQVDAKRQSLSVSGEQQTEQVDRDASGQVISRSRSSSRYSTSFSLPEPVKPDGLKSHYEDGKLHIEIPRLYKEA